MAPAVGVEVLHLKQSVDLIIFISRITCSFLLLIAHKENLSVSIVFDICGTAECPISMISSTTNGFHGCLDGQAFWGQDDAFLLWLRVPHHLKVRPELVNSLLLSARTDKTFDNCSQLLGIIILSH